MLMTHAQTPGPSRVPPEMKDQVLHARIAIGRVELSGADIPNAQPMRSAYLTLGVDSDAEAQRIFTALSDGGEVFMPLQETFFLLFRTQPDDVEPPPMATRAWSR